MRNYPPSSAPKNTSYLCRHSVHHVDNTTVSPSRMSVISTVGRVPRPEKRYFLFFRRMRPVRSTPHPWGWILPARMLSPVVVRWIFPCLFRSSFARSSREYRTYRRPTVPKTTSTTTVSPIPPKTATHASIANTSTIRAILRQARSSRTRSTADTRSISVARTSVSRRITSTIACTVRGARGVTTVSGARIVPTVTTVSFRTDSPDVATAS